MVLGLVLTQITMNAIWKRSIILVNIWKKDKFYSDTVIVTILMKRCIIADSSEASPTILLLLLLIIKYIFTR